MEYLCVLDNYLIMASFAIFLDLVVATKIYSRLDPIEY
jgi:hypothetical protein